MSKSTPSQTTPVQDTNIKDPKGSGPAPPFDQGKIAYPGAERDMREKPDHGEDSYHGCNRLNGRTALITGGDSGIGRAVALAFAREGADVAISYLPEEEQDAAESARWVKEAGRKVLLLPGDIRDEKRCTDIVGRTVQELGKLDILVNNAAFQMTHDSIEEFSTEEFDRTFKTNVYAMFWLCRTALPLMKPGSAIVNTTSIQAFNPSPNLLAYASSKAAIANFTKGLAKSAMKRGVRVNAVAPAADSSHDAGGKGETLWRADVV
jgi:NAD(P)-dependent dehydrogenase (short-subunit alcohol dehydrogenase family)